MANVTSSGNTTIKPPISAAKFMGASHASGSSLENQIRINTINISSPNKNKNSNFLIFLRFS